jgi:PAS domain S-box-containing protein
MKKTIQAIFQVPAVSDPDDARRRRILNILLASTFLLTILGLIFVTIIFANSSIGFTAEDMQLIFLSGPILLIITIIIFVINRFVSGKLASTMFLLMLLVLFVFTDSPEQVSNGRTLFVFAIPVVISSLLLSPISSFVFAGLGSLEIALLSYSISQPPNSPAIVGFFLLAVVSWLSARSLEQALKELRTINAELDRRVEDRTRELSEALARELIEAGKNQAILEGIADGVIVFDTQGKSIVANPALSRLLDIPSDNFMNKTMEEILQTGKTSSPDRQTTLTMLREPHKDKPSIRFRWGERTLLVNAAPVSTGLGDVIGTVAVFRDFTHEAEVEQMKNTFVAMVSHELRTPLNAILGFAEMIREAVYGPITAPQAGVMERIENSSRRLLSLVSDLLDQAQIEAGQMKIHFAEFQASDLLDSLRTALDKQAAEKGLTLTTKIEPDVPSVLLGDFNRLQQVLLNLGGNAVKFTESGGVTVRMYRVDERYWGFNVTDTGPGISAEARGYIFESFRQVEGVVTREHGGIGLGLAIVKSLVELMGGQILLASEVGKGATFTVTLPFEPSKEKTK